MPEDGAPTARTRGEGDMIENKILWMCILFGLAVALLRVMLGV